MLLADVRKVGNRQVSNVEGLRPEGLRPEVSGGLLNGNVC